MWVISLDLPSRTVRTRWTTCCCTLWGGQAAWICWSRVETRTTGGPRVSTPPLTSFRHITPSTHPTSVYSQSIIITFFVLNFHTGFLHPSILSSILSSIQPTYIFTQPPWQIIPPSVLSHLRRHPALPLFILTTIPSHLLSCPPHRPVLTSFSSCSSTFPTFAVPRSSSNLENTERKRVKTRLKKLILKRPPLQALQEKGLIKGNISYVFYL